MSSDPITQLLSSLERHGKPPLAWVVEWSAGGVDPVLAAWPHSSDVRAMGRILSRAGWERELRVVQDHGILPRVPVGGILAISRSQRSAERFRRLVPRPPTLDELIAAGRAARD